jgi:hypothetical protein
MKKIRIKIILFLFLFSLSVQVEAQKDSIGNKQKIAEVAKYRSALIKQKLDLSESEAKQFFPIYDAYLADLTKSKKSFRNKWKKKDLESLTEEEAIEYYNDALALQQKEVDLFKNCHEQLKSFMPMTKIIRISSVEREIRTKLINKANEIKLPKSKKKTTSSNSEDVK